MLLQYSNISTDTLHSKALEKKNVELCVVRLDKVHPVISGNKIFKLHYFLETIKERKSATIVTFGGAYSNHLVATAHACQLNNIACVGMVRGERPPQLSHTLQHCLEYGMQLQFISREQYHYNKLDVLLPAVKAQYPDCIIIPEGGYDEIGARGAALINNYIDPASTHICGAVGTGTTLAGILMNALPTQNIIGFPVLKGMTDMDARMIHLCGADYKKDQLHFEYDYHFGGYAKKTPALIEFMNAFYSDFQLPTDFVYTGKLMYGVMDLIKKDYFPAGSKITCIHSGGLQGNLSLPKNTLTFN